jgi:SAM-dependent methyltransferase
VTDELRRALLDAYFAGQGRTASRAMYDQLQSIWPYYAANYTEVVVPLPRSACVLEIGCGHGSLLAWLRSLGFEHVEGVDASPGDVEFANAHLGVGTVEVGDAAEYLAVHPHRYDLIVAKAIVEHIPRNELLTLLDAVRTALRPAGVFLVDVPNMDWLLAGHERYMDLTHENGFTRESLRSLLELRFTDVDVRGSRLFTPTRAQRMFRRPLVWALRKAFYVLGEGGNEFLFDSRSLIARARSRSV